jgi:hypothetical protein
MNRSATPTPRPLSPISAAVAKAASLADTAELLACRAAAEIDEAAGQNQFADGKS